MLKLSLFSLLTLCLPGLLVGDLFTSLSRRKLCRTSAASQLKVRVGWLGSKRSPQIVTLGTPVGRPQPPEKKAVTEHWYPGILLLLFHFQTTVLQVGRRVIRLLE